MPSKSLEEVRSRKGRRCGPGLSKAVSMEIGVMSTITFNSYSLVHHRTLRSGPLVPSQPVCYPSFPFAALPERLSVPWGYGSRLAAIGTSTCRVVCRTYTIPASGRAAVFRFGSFRKRRSVLPSLNDQGRPESREGIARLRVPEEER